MLKQISMKRMPEISFLYLLIFFLGCNTQNIKNNDQIKAGREPVDAILIEPTIDIQESEIYTIKGDGDVLWFKFKLKADTVYNFESIGDTDTGDPWSYIYDEDMRIAAKAADNAGVGYNFLFTYSAIIDGLYYMKIYLLKGDKWTGKIKYNIIN